jgi:hypothetical protein
MCKIVVYVFVVLGLLVLGAAETTANPIPRPTGHVSPYVDIAGTDYLTGNPEGIVRIYFFLESWMTGEWVTGVGFSAPKPNCFNAEFLGEVLYFATAIGHIQTGVGIAFGACLTSSRVLLGKLTYEAVGSLPCCHYWVCPDPAAPSGKIELVDCNDTKHLGTGGALVLNTATYPCEDSNTTPCQQPVPVESSTWGKVKSLYAQ